MTAKGSDSLTWDDNGRMIVGVSSSLTYNWEGKLQSGSAAGDSIDLKYAPGFDRVYKESTVSQTTTKAKYIVDPTGDLSLILLEIDPDGNDPNDAIRKTYIYANSQTIAQHNGNYDDAIYFYLNDRIGSVRQVIDVNASVEHLYTYGPFGKKLEDEEDADPVGNAICYTGQYYDEEIAQYHLRARQYAPQLYRFITRDPYSGTFRKALTLHRYLYCLNDPINRTDIEGLMSLSEEQSVLGTGAKIQSGTDYALQVKDYVRQFTQGVSVRNILLGAAANILADKVGGKAFDAVLGKATKAFSRMGGDAVKYGKKGGHHILPKWMGGDEAQYLANIDWNTHHRELEKTIRSRMKDLGITIGGRGNKAAKTFDYINDHGLMGDVFDELGDVYREFDREKGTNLFEGFIMNVLDGMHKGL